MRGIKILSGLGLSALLFAGCAGGVGSQSVTKTCSLDKKGMALKVTISAPGEDKDISSMDLHMSASLSALGLEEEGVSKEDVNKNLTLYGNQMKKMISSQLGVSEDDVEVKIEGDNLVMRMNIKDFAKFLKIINVRDQNQDMTLKTAVKDLEDAGGRCE